MHFSFLFHDYQLKLCALTGPHIAQQFSPFYLVNISYIYWISYILDIIYILDFWCKIRFRIHIITIQGQRHPLKIISNIGQMITSNLILDCQIEQLDNYGRGLGCLGGNYHQKNSNIRALGQNSPTCWLS